MAACDTINKFNLSDLCVTTCFNESRKFLSLDGVNCVSSCSVGYYTVSTEIQCITSCHWPYAFYVNSSFDSSEKRCSASCPSGTFLDRDTLDCVHTCEYLNDTLTGGNTVCEIPGNATNCPFLRFTHITDSFLTCTFNCTSSELIYWNSTFMQCIPSCPAAAQYIQLDNKTCNTTCDPELFFYNFTKNNPHCVTASYCVYPYTTRILNSTYDNYYDCEVTCELVTGVQNQFLYHDQ